MNKTLTEQAIATCHPVAVGKYKSIYEEESFSTPDFLINFLQKYYGMNFSWKKLDSNSNSISIDPTVVDWMSPPAEKIKTIANKIGIESEMIPVGEIGLGEFMILLEESGKIYLYHDTGMVKFGGQDFLSFLENFFLDEKFPVVYTRSSQG